MNDEGLGLAGWLLADLVLALAVVFLAIVPGHAEPAAHDTSKSSSATPTPSVGTKSVHTGVCLPQTDFEFDQIDVRGVVPGRVTWAQIAESPVLTGLTKGQELLPIDNAAVVHKRSSLTAEQYLRQRESEGYRIALLETFGWSAPRPLSTDIAHSVNESFLKYLSARTSAPDGLIFLKPAAESETWVADYLSTTIKQGSARMDLYFVKALPGDCAS